MAERKVDLLSKYGSEDREHIREVAVERAQRIFADPNLAEGYKKATEEVTEQALKDVIKTN